ncbi:MAG: RNA polymerase sigma factor [Candidatus Paceibacterota bacterium]
MNIADPKSLGDADILKLSIDKPAFFEELVGRYQRAFVRKATSILGNEDDANDVVQETFVRIYIAAGKFRPQAGASFSSWAYTILVNQCYTAYRKKQRADTVSLDLEPEFAEIIPDQAGLAALEQRLTADHVMRLLSKLPVLLRRAVELHFIDGLPQKEIAEREGVSHGVIRQRIHRAKKEMQKIDMNMSLSPISIK